MPSPIIISLILSLPRGVKSLNHHVWCARAPVVAWHAALCQIRVVCDGMSPAGDREDYSTVVFPVDNEIPPDKAHHYYLSRCFIQLILYEWSSK